MPGTATLGSNLYDQLATVIDDVRALHVDFGTRRFRVYSVVRTWSGSGVGVGSSSDVETEITPRPLVEPYRLENKLEPCGLDEDGFVWLREISMTYKEGEITGRPLTAKQQHFIVLRDGYGQAMPDRYYVVNTPPYPDVIANLGWEVELRRATP